MSEVNHVGIIMDGNRRFSKQLMRSPWKGHEWGAKKLQDVLVWCEQAGIKELTVFALSLQNFSRPKKEFDYLMKLFNKEITQLLKKIDEVNKRQLNIRFLGRTHLLPKDIQARMQELQEATARNNAYTINILVAYGGREEIVDAAKQLAQDVAEGKLKPEAINEHVFARSLSLQSEPELIIRTGGDHRTSNFLSWQSIYTEWFFVEELWPEFTKETFTQCLEEYTKRERRFGK